LEGGHLGGGEHVGRRFVCLVQNLDVDTYRAVADSHNGLPSARGGADMQGRTDNLGTAMLVPPTDITAPQYLYLAGHVLFTDDSAHCIFSQITPS